MIVIQGKCVSKGVASGPIYFFQRASATITDAPAADIEAEKARIAAAQDKSAQQLNALADKARAEAGDETAILFETHAMFVEDDDYVECMMNALEEKHCTAEKAVEIAGEEFSAMLAAMDDAYMQARAAAIKAVTPEEIAVSITGELIYERALRREAALQQYPCQIFYVVGDLFDLL